MTLVRTRAYVRWNPWCGAARSASGSSAWWGVRLGQPLVVGTCQADHALGRSSVEKTGSREAAGDRWRGEGAARAQIAVTVVIGVDGGEGQFTRGVLMGVTRVVYTSVVPDRGVRNSVMDAEHDEQQRPDQMDSLGAARRTHGFTVQGADLGRMCAIQRRISSGVAQSQDDMSALVSSDARHPRDPQPLDL
jgi:hypothetical protein